MVEGPGCKLKGEKMKAKVVGQTLKEVSGNAIENRPKRDLNKPTPYHALINKKIIDVKTLGKELFIFFCSGECLRVHFLMAGFVRYNDKSEDPDEGAQRKDVEKPRLQLQLNKDVVSLYQCSTDLRNGEKTLERWTNQINLDICWPEFDAQRAAREIMDPRNSERLICDVILDQLILPGVGNIIKNEALFDAGINPLTKVKDLEAGHVSRLVKMNRDFSLIFYDCRKTGKSLDKYYKMYRFSVCKQCNGRVTKCKPGEYERGTYFCAHCQNNALHAAGPSKNSLLGWTSASTSTWPCESCTFENKPGSIKCFACGTSKAKRKSSEPANFFTKKPRLAEKSQNIVASSAGGTSTNSATKAAEQKEEDKPDLCKGHKKPCVTKIVNKEGATKGRSFFTCPMPRAKSCNHFSWADLNNPRCKHNCLTFLREVYKQNQNNGRSFFVCPKPKKEQCDFFQWK